MANYPLYIALPGMEVYLAESFFKSQLDRPKRMHSHPAYELVCVEKGDQTEFVIVPPLIEHLAAEASPGSITSLLFSFYQTSDNDICLELENIKDKPVIVTDDFDGLKRIHKAKQLASNLLQPGAMEQLAAEFRLLFVCLARKLSSRESIPAMHRQTLYEERLAILEDYFNIGLKDPDCSKLQLAGRLGVTERQLTRILSEVYHSTFSDILLRSRMSIAHAMVMEGRKTPEEIALAVGYRSAESMKRAYRAFWGFPLKATKQDTKTV